MAYVPLAQHYSDIYVLSRTLRAGGVVQAVLNDSFHPDYVGMTSEVSGLDSAEVNESADNKVMEDGGNHGDFFYGRRPISMNVEVFNAASMSERDIRIDKARRASNAMRGDATLSWVPAQRVTNWMSNPKVATEILTNSWAGFPAGLTSNTRVTGENMNGTTTAYEIGAATGSNAAVFGNSTIAPVNSSSTYLFTADAKVTAQAATGGSLQLRYRAINAAGGFISESTIATVSNPVVGTTNTLSAIVTPAQLPGGTASLSWSLWYFFPATTGTYVYRTTNVGIIEAASGTTLPVAYVDGGTAGYQWFGNPNLSPSGNYLPAQIKVRRQQPFRDTGTGWAKQLQMLLVAEDARIYNTYAHSTTALATSATTTSPASIEQRGSDERGPVTLRIIGPCTNPVLTNTLTGEVVRFTAGYSVPAGTVLDVDVLHHTAIDGTSVDKSQFVDYVNSTWPLAVQGTNSYVLTGTAMTVGTSGVTATLTDSWV